MDPEELERLKKEMASSSTTMTDKLRKFGVMNDYRMMMNNEEDKRLSKKMGGL